MTKLSVAFRNFANAPKKCVAAQCHILSQCADVKMWCGFVSALYLVRGKSIYNAI